jgi:starch synthase
MTFSSLLFPFFLAIAFAFCGCIKSKVDSQKLNSNQTSREKVLLVSAEQTGVFNTGGLGHTVASLAQALEQGGIDTDVLMPFYSEITPTIRDTAHRTSQSFTVTLNALPGRQGEATFTFDLYSHDNPQSGVRTWLLKHEGNGTQGGLFDNTPRPGEARRYTNQDEGEAFLAFNKAAAQFVDKHEHTIVNIHDWHAGFVRNGVKDRSKRFLLTISNMGYQGLFEGSLAGRAGMGPDDFQKTTEFYGKFNFLKHGITTSDMVLTVAPNYLREIATARFGSGLEGLVQQTAREFRISAILNGTDVESWNPQRQFHKSIVHTFHPEDLSGKEKGKALLQAELGLRISERTPLVCMTSRIADQKGYAYLTEALATVAQRRDVQFVILGDGEPRYLAKVEELAKNFPGKVLHKAFDAVPCHSG